MNAINLQAKCTWCLCVQIGYHIAQMLLWLDLSHIASISRITSMIFFLSHSLFLFYFYCRYQNISSTPSIYAVYFALTKHPHAQTLSHTERIDEKWHKKYYEEQQQQCYCFIVRYLNAATFRSSWVKHSHAFWMCWRVNCVQQTKHIWKEMEREGEMRAEKNYVHWIEGVK